MSAKQGLWVVLKPANRLKIHATSLVAAFFLAVYAQLICPFIAKLDFSVLMFTLLSFGILQIVMRESFYCYLPTSKGTASLARHGYHLSIATWFLTGIVAFMTHFFLYEAFPMASHVKLLSGYWALGAGILAQWEYVEIETAYRQNSAMSVGARHYWERLTQRVLEGYGIFTIVPAMAMMLMISRYVYEGEQGITVGPEVVLEVVFLGMFFVVAALVVAWRFGKVLKKDTAHIMDGIQNVADGVFDFELDTSRPDEFGEVAQGINNMASGLLQREQIRAAFGHFVPPEVAKDFLERYSKDEDMLGGERRELTILMSDLRDFTPLSETLEPEELIELMNAYFSEMVLAIRAHGGVVDKFMGDAIMAIFGLVFNEDECHSKQAVCAGLEMLERLEKHNAERMKAKPGSSPLKLGVGIHTGEVVAGYVESHDRLEFTVLGQNVNLAARIEGQTKAPAPPLLFSKEVADKVASKIDVEEVLTADLKGVSEPVKLFSVKSVVASPGK